MSQPIFPLLFTPFTMGEHVLKNRICLAPLTRLRAEYPGECPSRHAAEYYRQRAGAGLVITEATNVSDQARGYGGAPGLYTPEQTEAWRVVVEAVHAEQSLISAQLWHTGAVSHHSLQPQQQAPISPSGVVLPGLRTSLRTEDGRIIRAEASPSRAASLTEIKQVVEQFAHSARCARQAGFDFIEIHAAHGYLLGQFFSPHTNQRDDDYGGSLENRARLIIEVVEACIAVWDRQHIGIRLSPMGMFNNVDMGYEEADSLYLIQQLDRRALAYLHISEPDWAGGQAFSMSYKQQLRQTFKGHLICAGGYTAEKAEQLLQLKLLDAVAFGRAFLSTPDLPQRILHGAELNPINSARVYGGGADGYTDYPILFKS